MLAGASTNECGTHGTDDAPLNILLYFFRLGESAGGAERMVCALANALCERGFSVHIASWDDRGAKAFYWLDPKIKWHRCGFRSTYADKVRRFRALIGILRAHKIDVLVGFVMSADKIVYTAAKLARVQVVVAERNAPSMYYLRYGRVKRWVCFLLLHSVSQICVQFPAFRNGYPRTLRNRISVIPNPVMASTRTSRPGEPDNRKRFTLLTVSRLDNVQKRIDCLVRAFARVAWEFPDWQLRIVGDGPDRGSVVSLIEGSKLEGRISLERPRADIHEEYVNAHLFAIPSLWEGFPNALAEALSHGVPAVGFRDASGVADLIQDGNTGWLADGLHGDDVFASALAAAMNADQERARRGRNATRNMAHYTSKTQFDSWVALIGSVTAGRAP